MIQMLVGRCHVGESDRAVLRYVISLLRCKYQTWRELPRLERREVMRAVFEAHAENRRLYKFVMNGAK